MEVDKNNHFVFLVIESWKLEPRDTTVTDYYTNQKREKSQIRNRVGIFEAIFCLI